MSTNLIKFFDSKEVRTQWNAEEEKWYFSIVDIIAILTESDNPRHYWTVLKGRLKTEGNQSVTNCDQLKLIAKDGKYYNTDVADLEQLFRLIQSVPSKNAEPFKMWLAEVGRDRVNETFDPELAINRALETFVRKGYSGDWINQRIKSIEVRKQLTDQWEKGAIKEPKDFAILTSMLTETWSGKTVKEYKKYKNLTSENLRDNMSSIEEVLSMLAEVTATEVLKKEKPKGLKDNIKVTISGGQVAKEARVNIEKLIDRPVVVSDKHNDENLLE